MFAQKCTVCFFAFFVIVNSHESECKKKSLLEMSKTNCTAGRRFFARFDQMPELNNIISATTFDQPYVFPWLAKISGFLFGNAILCTGTLINDRYVITAQRCVLKPLTPELLTVTLGYEVGSVPEQYQSLKATHVEKRVDDIVRYPGYDPNSIHTSSNDLALLLIEPITYSKTIYPIQLPTVADKYKPLEGTECENVGWKASSPNGFRKKPTFNKLSVQIIPNYQCNSFNIYFRYLINPEVICGMSKTKILNRESCASEIGAPLMMEDHDRVYNVTVLIGVTTWSAPKDISCTWNRTPIVYVKIADKVQWIMENTKNALYCKY